MRARMVSVPELAMIAGTRVAGGVGLGLLLAESFERDRRRAVGWTLLAVGVISTIPLMAEVMFRNGRTGATERLEGAAPASP
jgi:hypothetical protein